MNLMINENVKQKGDERANERSAISLLFLACKLSASSREWEVLRSACSGTTTCRGVFEGLSGSLNLNSGHLSLHHRCS